MEAYLGSTLWCQKKSSGSRAAAKLHVVWNVCGEWVEDFIVTPARRHDSPVGRFLKLLPGKTYVFDRAYNDLSFWYEIQKKGSHFVTRLRNISRNRYLELMAGIHESSRCKILFDGFYKPSVSSLSHHPEVPKDIKCRHIIYRDLKTNKIFHFVTSDFKSSATW